MTTFAEIKNGDSLYKTPDLDGRYPILIEHRRWLIAEVERLEARNRFLEEMGAECAQDWQKIERLLARIKELEGGSARSGEVDAS